MVGPSSHLKIMMPINDLMQTETNKQTKNNLSILHVLLSTFHTFLLSRGPALYNILPSMYMICGQRIFLHLYLLYGLFKINLIISDLGS